MFSDLLRTFHCSAAFKDLQPSSLTVDRRHSDGYVAPTIQYLTLKSSRALPGFSDIDLNVPGAIVQPATEEDVIATVKLAAQHNVAFVPKSGGHTLWSTIGTEGFIVDLSLFKRLSVDKSTGQITLLSGVLPKEANNAAFKNGLCLRTHALLSLGLCFTRRSVFSTRFANPAGVIPMALGGGLNGLPSHCGCTSDNIVSARVVTADWTLLTFFGLVTERTLQGHPLSVLGTDDGTICTGSILFPANRLTEVIAAMELIINETTAPSSGFFIFTTSPPNSETLILVLPFDLGPASAFYKPPLDLNLLINDLKNVTFNRKNDSVESFCGKGGLERFAATTFKLEMWPRILEYFEELKTKCPDAAATVYAFEWDSYVPKNKRPAKDTAFSRKDIRIWVASRFSFVQIHCSYGYIGDAVVVMGVYQAFSRSSLLAAHAAHDLDSEIG
ncbi:hypothetical protein B0H17DRAFT_1214041 [Mycena rosella]|uniref:FAD-binding PCMH-type domain-containing protein n=1 Tax=Mycena rosella TaxID=1033263 RepID=A0AAD7CPL2_MYCRO|nr:hypothetical protein B0H17DRAFT_1214041 [Mycena rosella]